MSKLLIPGLTQQGALLNPLPEGTVRIGDEVWTQNNYDKILTPANNSIIEIQTAANIEFVNNKNFETNDSYWGKPLGTVASRNTVSPISGLADFKVDVSGSTWNGSVIPYESDGSSIIPVVGKWYRVNFKYRVDAGGEIAVALYDFSGVVDQYVTDYLNATVNTEVTVYVQATSTKYFSVIPRYNAGVVFSYYIDDFSVQEVGWVGLTSANVAAWAHHSNDAALGLIYARMYNGVARDLISADMASEAYGWHIATEAELTSLALNGGYALKEAGTEHWLTDTGTNSTKFTALGGGVRSDVDGAFSAIKETTAFWCGDSDKVLVLNHADNSAIIQSVTKGYGAYIRLVSDSQFPIPLT